MLTLKKHSNVLAVELTSLRSMLHGKLPRASMPGSRRRRRSCGSFKSMARTPAGHGTMGVVGGE